MCFLHRTAKRDDLDQIVGIYNAIIESRQVTADTSPVSVESRVAWFEGHSPNFRPLWVAESEKRIVGWLSFSSFYGRPAYDKTAELSVYVHEELRNRGLGSYFIQSALGAAVPHPLHQEFEQNFVAVSIPYVKSQPGLISVAVGRPTRWVPDEHVMITVWRSETDLVHFAGENWNRAVIQKVWRNTSRSAGWLITRTSIPDSLPAFR